MHGNAGHVDPVHGGGHAVNLDRAGPVDAKFVFGLAGSDFFVGFGIDMRVDADRDAGLFAHVEGNPVEFFEFRDAFDIDLGDIGIKGFAHFGIGLANAGKNDFARCDTGAQGTAHFTNRNHIGTGPQFGECFQHSLIGVRLDGVANRGIKPVKRTGINVIVTFKGGGGIAIERRADFFGKLGDGNAFGVKDAINIFKMVHCAGYVRG